MARWRLTRANLGQRAQTISVRAIERARAESERLASCAPITYEDRMMLADRPRTRAECVDGPRPCPWVGCKQNLYLDVSPHTGSIKINFPDRDPEDMPAEWSCVLDVADRGGVTLEEIGAAVNCTRERVRQLETAGLAQLKILRRRLQ